MPPISVHVHSCSLRHHFAYQQGFDVFAFIALARAQGFDGVCISVDGPGFGHLGGTDSGHFASVRDALVAHELGVELDTGDTRPQHLHLLLEVSAALGAERLQTTPHHQGTPQQVLQQTLADLSTASERAGLTGVRIVLEDREDLRGETLAALVRSVDSDYVRALFDYGKARKLGEDPLAALEAVLSVVDAVRVKDHLLVNHAGEVHAQGVAVGEGTLPIESLTRQLYAAGLRRFCFENEWSCVTPLEKSAADLPDGPVFTVHDDHPLIDGEQLDPASAMKGERHALLRGWHWFDNLLTTIDEDQGLVRAVEPERPRTAPDTG